jgi:hypothetical protein
MWVAVSFSVARPTTRTVEQASVERSRSPAAEEAERDGVPAEVETRTPPPPPPGPVRRLQKHRKGGGEESDRTFLQTRSRRETQRSDNSPSSPAVVARTASRSESTGSSSLRGCDGSDWKISRTTQQRTEKNRMCCIACNRRRSYSGPDTSRCRNGMRPSSITLRMSALQITYGSELW